MNVVQLSAKIRHRAQELRRVSRAELIYIRERACSMDTVSTQGWGSVAWPQRLQLCQLVSQLPTNLPAEVVLAMVANIGGYSPSSSQYPGSVQVPCTRVTLPVIKTLAGPSSRRQHAASVSCFPPVSAGHSRYK